MSDVKWIKLTTDMFDNRKIKHLRKLPEGNSIVLIWIMLLTMAGRCNSGGMIFLTENIPYTPKMLADELDFEESTINLALQALEQLGMISMDASTLFINGWQEHQNIEGMDLIREQNRERKRRFDERKKALLGSNVTGNVTVTQSNATDIDIEEDIDIDKDIEEEKSTTQRKSRVDYHMILDLYHYICVSFPKVRTLSDSRKRSIKARLEKYSLEEIKEAFTLCEASDFLKGKNDSGWKADFDWIMNDTNIGKILDGKYNNRNGRSTAAKNYDDVEDGFL